MFDYNIAINVGYNSEKSQDQSDMASPSCSHGSKIAAVAFVKSNYQFLETVIPPSAVE